MNLLPTSRGMRRRTAVVAAVLGVSALALVGCAQSSASTTGSSSSPSGSGGSSSKVAAAEKISTSLPIPTADISGVSTLAGKTVYFIPITLQAPQMGVTQTALKAALTAAGLKLQTCNGEGTPTAIGACVQQAVNAKAGAIVTDAIPYAEASNALDAAQSAGVPVLNTDQIIDSSHPASKTLGYIEAPGDAQMAALMDWIAQDSKGRASIVINQSTDGPAPASFLKAGQSELKSVCPSCTTTINNISSANFSLVAPSTSSALLKTPNAGYLVTEFEQFVQPTLGGVQQAGKTGSIKGAVGAAQLASLQMLAKKNFVAAADGQDAVFQGWADADAALRLMTGTTLPKYTIPTRLFTADNIGSVKLTAAAQNSGEWYGPTDFPSKFAALWGVK